MTRVLVHTQPSECQKLEKTLKKISKKRKRENEREDEGRSARSV